MLVRVREEGREGHLRRLHPGPKRGAGPHGLLRQIKGGGREQDAQF